MIDADFEVRQLLASAGFNEKEANELLEETDMKKLTDNQKENLKWGFVTVTLLIGVVLASALIYRGMTTKGFDPAVVERFNKTVQSLDDARAKNKSAAVEDYFSKPCNTKIECEAKNAAYERMEASRKIPVAVAK